MSLSALSGKWNMTKKDSSNLEKLLKQNGYSWMKSKTGSYLDRWIAFELISDSKIKMTSKTALCPHTSIIEFELNQPVEKTLEHDRGTATVTASFDQGSGKFKIETINSDDAKPNVCECYWIEGEELVSSIESNEIVVNQRYKKGKSEN